MNATVRTTIELSSLATADIELTARLHVAAAEPQTKDACDCNSTTACSYPEPQEIGRAGRTLNGILAAAPQLVMSGGRKGW